MAPKGLYSSDIVVIDLEASCPPEDEGQNDVSRSNIIEIGAVRLEGKSLALVDTFSELVKPRDYPIPPYIAGLTGITPEMVEGKDDFGVVGRRFIEWFGPRSRGMLAAFGAYYDIPLLRKECIAFHIRFGAHFVGGAMDVRSIALAWLATQGHNTSGVTIERTIRRMGLEHLDLSHHRALDDARAGAAILQHFHGQQVDV
jgi:DNA polymerase III epsilon subunit-like protein